MWTIVAVVVVLLILIFAEYLSRYKGVHSELTRKLVHILVGIFVAFWPFFLSWRQIQALSFLFVVVVLISIRLHIFNAIHAVSRNTFGEVLFGASIGILALISSSPWVFAAAMLHLSLAGGLAVAIGLAYGGDNSYRILGRTKSLAGSLAFFFASIGIMFWYSAFSASGFGVVSMFWLPLATTLAENLSTKGMDNLVIPLLVAMVLAGNVQ